MVPQPEKDRQLTVAEITNASMQLVDEQLNHTQCKSELYKYNTEQEGQQYSTLIQRLHVQR